MGAQGDSPPVHSVGVFDFASATNTETQNTTTATDGNVLAQNLWTASVPGSYTQTVASSDNEDDYNIAAVGDAASFGTDWILIPQQLTYATQYSSADADFAGACLKIRLKIKNNAGSDAAYIVGGTASEGGADEEGYVTAMWPLSAPVGGWLPGTKYTFTVDLAGGGYWYTDKDSNEDLDPILDGAEIKFVTVTVDTWDETGGSIYSTGL